MKQEEQKIGHIPTVIWGEPSNRVILAVHGNMSCKSDTPIKVLAEVASNAGYQVLSFDLPEHGDRKMESTLCKVQICVEELSSIMQYAKTKWKHIHLFANSIGAYFSLLSYYKEPLESALFLSPVVDMKLMIETMMTCFDVTKAELQKKQEIQTPIGQVLYWDYYCYVLKHPIETWDVSTSILYGEHDELCEKNTIIQFVKQFSCHLDIVSDAQHYFHTPKQIDELHHWLEDSLVSYKY